MARKTDPYEIFQVWADPEQDYKPFRIVVDNQGSGGGAGSRPFEVVVDDVVVFAVDASGNVTAGGVAAAGVSATGSSLTVTQALHAGRNILLNRAAGIAVTLPAATGSGAKYSFIVGTTTTSGGYIIKVVGNDIIQGVAWATQDSADTVVAWETAADSDTFTWNGTTMGGYIGDRLELVDIAADTWAIQAWSKATGPEASPFSATV
jgi:hypothetical protein